MYAYICRYACLYVALGSRQGARGVPEHGQLRELFERPGRAHGAEEAAAGAQQHLAALEAKVDGHATGGRGLAHFEMKKGVYLHTHLHTYTYAYTYIIIVMITFICYF